MALDFRQVQEQVRQLGENAPARQRDLQERRDAAQDLLEQFAADFDSLKARMARVVREFEPSLRCAAPASQLPTGPEPLTTAFPVPALPPEATILAADGSQINLDRHAEVEYCLVNVGAIQFRLGASDPPQPLVRSELKYDEALFTPTGMISDGMLALMRDKAERAILAELACEAKPPVIAFTDGPVELWGARESIREEADFKEDLHAYLQALTNLCEQGVTTAGYVDKPSANLMVRLLEIVKAAESDLKDIRKFHPLRGVTDFYLYSLLLGPGERSAVFELQSQSKRDYTGDLALHFFYLNVGRADHPWLARVEAPAWVVADPQKLNLLHAVLVDQCKIMGARPYPYLLHRAHETAVVSLDEKDQVTRMISLELRRRGVEVGERSQKQAAKDLTGRARYK